MHPFKARKSVQGLDLSALRCHMTLGPSPNLRVCSAYTTDCSDSIFETWTKIANGMIVFILRSSWNCGSWLWTGCGHAGCRPCQCFQNLSRRTIYLSNLCLFFAALTGNTTSQTRMTKAGGGWGPSLVFEPAGCVPAGRTEGKAWPPPMIPCSPGLSSGEDVECWIY